ncbi:MAG: protein kinase [Blastocatellia bacterium]|nr:protein kinase [Blastocatellia bacterium]MBK6427495.1 protein kinase [Blastocatellia bacterium]
MTAERLKQIRDLFDQVIACPPFARQAFLRNAAANDVALREAVETLLREHDEGPAALAVTEPSDGREDVAEVRDEPSSIAPGLVGTVIADRYRLDARIGAGGMGLVYRATQLNLKRTVAVKLVHARSLAEPPIVARFEREALAIASLKHPRIITIFDFGVAPDIGMYIVMEYLAGRPLSDELAEMSPMAPAAAVRLARQVCSALQAAHRAGIVHRDLKPDNIFLETTPEGPMAKVLDFGIAKLRTGHDADVNTLTSGNAIIGTPRYMSPEQIENAPVDGRADVYSLGCVLYEMLTGSPPFPAAKLSVLLTQHLVKPARPPSEVTAGVPPELDAIVLRALAKLPEDRYQTADDFGHDLAIVDEDRRGEPVALADHIVSQATSESTARTSASSMLVGREAETVALRRRLEMAVAGECQLVLITGDAGVGKSHLVDYVEMLAHGAAVRVVRGRFAEADLGIPYNAFCDAIRDVIRSSSDGAAAVADLLPELTALFPVLGEMTELRSLDSSTGGRTLDTDHPESQTAVFELIARAFARIARTGPLVVCLEDLHASDVAFLAVQFLVSRLQPLPILIVATSRTSDLGRPQASARLLDALREERRFAAIPLEPFTLEEQTAFVGLLLGEDTVDPVLAERLHDVSAGNPYFTRELVRSLVETSRIERGSDGVWVASGHSGEFTEELPLTVRQAVTRRVERLPVHEHELLRMASVLGRRFPYRELEIMAADVEDLDAIVERLVESGFLEEHRQKGGDDLAFTSGALHKVLLRSLSRRKRRLLHARHAAQLEAQAAGRIERILPQLVHHYAHGDVAEKTVEHATHLARRALDAWSPDEAVRAMRTAVGLLEREGSDAAGEGEARLLLAEALAMAGDIDDGLRELGIASDAFSRARNRARELDVMVVAAELAWKNRRIDAARRWVTRGTDAARALRRDSSLVRLLDVGATMANLRGDHARAQSLLEEADRLRSNGSEPLDAMSPVPVDTPLEEAAAVAVTGETTLAGRGILRIPYHATVQSLDPCLEPNDVHAGIVLTVFETLTHEGKGARIAPWLASEVTTEDGGRRYRIRIREGVRFHDGRPLTARDVRYTFERVMRFPDRRWLLDRVSGAADLYEGRAPTLEGVRVVDDSELTVSLDEPLGIFPAVLTHSSLAIVPEGTDAIDGAVPGSCIGTGPFRVTRFEPGHRLDQEANPDYWRAGFPRSTGLSHRFGLAQSDILTGFREHRYSLAWNLDAIDRESLRNDPEYGPLLHEYPTLATYFLVFNAHSGPLADESLRRRLASSVDVDALARASFGASAMPARSLIPPGLLGYEPPRRVPGGDAPPKRSEATLTLTAAMIPGVAESLERSLSAAFGREGVRLDVSIVAGGTLEATCREATVDVIIGGWLGDYPDADAFVYPVLHSEAGLYGRFVGGPELDRLCEAGRVEADPDARHDIYRRVETLLAEKALLVPFCHRQSYCFVQPEIRAVRLRLSPSSLAFDRLRLAD